MSNFVIDRLDRLSAGGGRWGRAFDRVVVGGRLGVVSVRYEASRRGGVLPGVGIRPRVDRPRVPRLTAREGL